MCVVDEHGGHARRDHKKVSKKGRKDGKAYTYTYNVYIYIYIYIYCIHIHIHVDVHVCMYNF